MCLVGLALGAAPDLPLVLAANRDERFTRPAAPARWWDDVPGLLAGRDLQARGTWLGLTRQGRVAALTNVRTPSPPAAPRSRGELVAGVLAAPTPPEAALGSIARELYPPFSLLAGGPAGLWWTSSLTGTVERLAPGIHGLSNHLPDSLWPKVLKVRQGLAQALEGPRAVLVERLFSLLADRSAAPDAALPDTGVGLALERGLAPVFVSLPGYGTRCSTVILFHGGGTVTFHERSFDEHAAVTGEVHVDFQVA